MKKVLLISLVVFITTSCNKTKTSSKSLQSTTWKFTSLTIDQVSDSSLATLSFEDGDIYNEVLLGYWYNTDTSTAKEVSFAWQFRDKGKTFEISNQSEGDEALLCSQLSGIYQVNKLENGTFSIQSTSTIGYPNKLVKIELAKK